MNTNVWTAVEIAAEKRYQADQAYRVATQHEANLFRQEETAAVDRGEYLTSDRYSPELQAAEVATRAASAVYQAATEEFERLRSEAEQATGQSWLGRNRNPQQDEEIDPALPY